MPVFMLPLEPVLPLLMPLGLLLPEPELVLPLLEPEFIEPLGEAPLDEPLELLPALPAAPLPVLPMLPVSLPVVVLLPVVPMPELELEFDPELVPDPAPGAPEVLPDELGELGAVDDGLVFVVPAPAGAAPPLLPEPPDCA